MRAPGLVVMSVVAVAVLGYAVYSLSGSEPKPAPSEPATESEPDKQSRRSPRPVTRGGVAPAPVSKGGDARRRGGPPPRPEPSVPLDQARREFAEAMDELDTIAAEGTTLTNEEWVGYYKKGHDKLQPLLQHLDWGVPAQAKELAKANDDLRTKLGAVDPGRVPK